MEKYIRREGFDPLKEQYINKEADFDKIDNACTNLNNSENNDDPMDDIQSFILQKTIKTEPETDDFETEPDNNDFQYESSNSNIENDIDEDAEVHSTENDSNQLFGADSHQPETNPEDSCGDSEQLDEANAKSTSKAKYPCLVCDKVLQNKKSLRIHMVVHTAKSEEQLKCELCDKTFSRANVLRRHLAVHGYKKGLPASAQSSVSHLKTALKDDEAEINNIKFGDSLKPVECKICERLFSNPNALKDHMASHADKPILSCDICNNNYGRLGSLKKHRLTHRKDKRFKCMMCWKRPTMDGKSLKCKICERMLFESKSITIFKPFLSQHNDDSNASEDFPFNKNQSFDYKTRYPILCPICKKNMKSTNALKLHLKEHTGEDVKYDFPFACDLCLRIFMKFSNLKFHRYNHVYDEAFKCITCWHNPPSEINKLECNTCEKFGEISSEDYEMADAINRLKQDPDCPLNIDKINTSTNYDSKLSIDSHDNNKEYADLTKSSENEERSPEAIKCEPSHTRNITNSKRQRKKATEKVENIQNELNPISNATPKKKKKIQKKPVPTDCLVCGMTLSCSDYLMHHMKIHTAEEPFSCDMCSFRFRKMTNMCRHRIQVHGTQKEFLCTICRKEPPSGRYSIRCKTCEETGNNSDPLLIDIPPSVDAITQETSFACPGCGDKCINRNELRMHYRSHTGERPFSCDWCSQDFRQKKLLVRHIIKFGHVKTIPRCETCNLDTDSFKNFSHYKNILNNPLPEVRKVLNCKDCEKNFANIPTHRNYSKGPNSSKKENEMHSCSSSESDS